MVPEDQHPIPAQQEAARTLAGEGLREWYRRPLGAALAESERHTLDGILADLFGYYLVQVGSCSDDYLLGASVIRHHIAIEEGTPDGQAGEDGNDRLSGISARASVLPLQGDSVDVVLLPHTLDFEAQPHQVLREVERVLVSEGHVVVMGFNPWSLWGIRRLFTWRRQRHPLWRGTFRSIIRIKDWLALLGFDIVMTRSCFFRPPLQHPALMRRLMWMERLGWRWWPYLGGTWVIVARKRVVTLTPIKPRWRPRRSLIHGDAIKPTTRESA